MILFSKKVEEHLVQNIIIDEKGNIIIDVERYGNSKGLWRIVKRSFHKDFAKEDVKNYVKIAKPTG